MPNADFDMANRTEEVVGGDLESTTKGNTRTDFEPHPNSVSHPKNKKKDSEARLVVEVFFDIPKDKLRAMSDRHDLNFLHPTDYLRWRKGQFESGCGNLADLLSDEFVTGKVRVEVSK